MADIPNSRLINFVDTPADIDYGAFGEARVNLEPANGGILDVTQFREVNVRIGATSASAFDLFIGKISGTTLSVRYTNLIDDEIHTFDITGPEIVLSLKGGPLNTKEQVQLWVYLRS